jgi:WD40 repeat protein
VIDAYLFSQTFAKSIEEHPLLVYYGALPFSPITSVLYQYYHDHSLFPTVVGGFLHFWSLPQVAVTEHNTSGPLALGGNYVISRDNTIYDLTPWTAATTRRPGGHGSIQSSTFSGYNKPVTSESRSGTFEGHPNGVTSAVFSPDGNRVVSGSYDGSMCMWDVETGQRIAGPFQGHTDWVTCLAFSPDSKQVSSGFRDGAILLWHAGQTNADSFTGHTDWVTSVAFSPDGKQMVSGSRDRTVRVWDIARHIAISLHGHTSWIRSVAFSPDGIQVVSGSVDRTVRIWDAQTGQTVSGPFECRKDWVHSVPFSPDNTQVVSRPVDISAHGWDAASSALEGRSSMSHYISCCTIEVNRDGWIIHVTTNRVISKLPSVISPLCSASIGSSVVVGTRNGQVIIITFPQQFV